MKTQYRFLSILLSLAFLMPIFPGTPVMAASHVVTITSPEDDHQIPDHYRLRFNVTGTAVPERITITYRGTEHPVVEKVVNPNVSSTATSSYETLLENIGAGENVITVTVTAADGTTASHSRRVLVDDVLTNIHSDQVNVSPYVTDRNKFKNLLKASNEIAVSGAAESRIRKDNAFINRFIDILFEEAALENIRPDIVFAQMMLETGWLTFQYTVQENQNNLGGIGATGGGVRGNLFPSLRIGIRANVQHLVAYASTRTLNGTRVDPRFIFVPRGSAPFVEYLGYPKNPTGAGWAMSSQYGYKVLDIISRLDKASAAPFAVTADLPRISEFEVSSIKRGDNPLNINLIPGFAVDQEIRLGVATNSDTQQRFVIRNIATGESSTTLWSEDRAVFYLPKAAGLYEFTAQIRSAGSTAIAHQAVQQVQIGPVSELPEDPDQAVVPVIGPVTLSSSPYYPGRPVTIALEAVSDATLRVNEYQLEVEHAGTTKLLSSWSMSPVYTYTPETTGDHLVRITSRNRLVGGEGIESVTVTIKVKDLDDTGDVIASVSATPASLTLGQSSTVSIKPMTGLPFALEYRLMEGTTVLSDWGSATAIPVKPTRTGDLTLKIQARRDGGNGTVLETESLLLKVNPLPMSGLRQIELSPAPYQKGSPITVRAIPHNPAEPNDFRLYIREGITYLPLTKWQSGTALLFTPAMSGTVELAVKARNRVTGKETQYLTKTITLANSTTPVYGPVGYVPENPQGVTVEGLHIAGVRAKDRALEINVNPVKDLEYRFSVISGSTGQRFLVKDWSAEPKAAWRSVFGYFTVVVEARHILSRAYHDVVLSQEIRIKSYPTVFLDPGHGGSDRGLVITRSGVTYTESALTLAMSQAVRSKLAGRGINVYASRSSNIFVSLDDRVAKANAAAADLFVSFHYNKSSYSSTRGIRTYYSGQTSDPLANRYLAEGQEAAAILSPKVGYYYPLNRGIITDLADMGYTFRILRETRMPAVQLNLGYLSNTYDLARIKSSWYRGQIAGAAADGIMSYLNQN